MLVAPRSVEANAGLGWLGRLMHPATDSTTGAMMNDLPTRIRRRAFRERRKMLLQVAEELPEAAWGSWQNAR